MILLHATQVYGEDLTLILHRQGIRNLSGRLLSAIGPKPSK